MIGNLYTPRYLPEVQLNNQELDSLRFVIRHGLKELARIGTYYDHRRGDLSVTCESLEYEYIDNDRLIWTLFQKYGQAFVDNLESLFLEYANQQFPDMSFQRDEYPHMNLALARRDRYSVELFCLSATRGNSEGFSNYMNYSEDTCCIILRNEIMQAHHHDSPSVVTIAFVNPSFTMHLPENIPPPVHSPVSHDDDSD